MKTETLHSCSSCVNFEKQIKWCCLLSKGCTPRTPQCKYYEKVTQE